jgi:hypothetical protein
LIQDRVSFFTTEFENKRNIKHQHDHGKSRAKLSMRSGQEHQWQTRGLVVTTTDRNAWISKTVWMIQQRVDRPALKKVSATSAAHLHLPLSHNIGPLPNSPSDSKSDNLGLDDQINVFPSSWLIRHDGAGVLSPVLLKKPAVVAHVSAHAPHRSSRLAPAAQLQQQQH